MNALSPGPVPRRTGPQKPVKRSARRLAVLAAASLALTLLIGLAIDALMDRFEYKIGNPDPTKDTVVELSLDGRYRDPRALDVGALWGTCATALTDRQLETTPQLIEHTHLRITVHPALSKHQRERLGGCLRDLTVHRIKTSHVTFTDRPATPATPETPETPNAAFAPPSR
jgi:hypothetical protein